MTQLQDLFNLLNGKKTYLISLVDIAYGVAHNNPEMVLAGLTAICLRHGIAKQ